MEEDYEVWLLMMIKAGQSISESQWHSFSVSRGPDHTVATATASSSQRVCHKTESFGGSMLICNSSYVVITDDKMCQKAFSCSLKHLRWS